MSWWLILLLMVAAFGPVLWIMPSRRDRMLTKLRAGARSRGLFVELTRIPDLAAPAYAKVTAGGVARIPTLACTAYQRPLPRAVNATPRWRLLANDGGGGPLPGWIFDGAGAGDDAYWHGATQVFAKFPDSILAVEAARNQVSVYWRERVDIEQIDTSLDALAESLEALADWHWEAEQQALARLAAAPGEER